MENIVVKFASDPIAQVSHQQAPTPFSLLHHIPLPILGLTLGCHLSEINQEAMDVYGWKKADVLGKSFLELCIRAGLPTPVLPDLCTIKPGQAYTTNKIEFSSQGKVHQLKWRIIRLGKDYLDDGFLWVAEALSSKGLEKPSSFASFQDISKNQAPLISINQKQDPEPTPPAAAVFGLDSLDSSTEVRGLRVLLVEDNLLAQKISKSMLEDLNCTVDIAATGEEALRLIKEPYDLVFMDIGLPDHDGLEVTRRIRATYEDKKDLPIIAMTAHVSEQDKQLCFESGMNGFIGKPVSYEGLQRVVQDCVVVM